MPLIHPTALVDPAAELADDVEIGPYTIVEAGARLGEGCRIGAHVTLGERLVLGRRVRVFNYACLGAASQDLKHRGEISYASLGDDVVVREFVTVNRGTREGSVTRIEAGALLLAYSHVAHECHVGEGALLVNAATLGGEVEVGPGAIVGGLACVHQLCRIGAHAMIGAGSKVVQDIPPFLLADGHPARPYGPNKIGLRRRGFSGAQIEQVRALYRLLYDPTRPMESKMSEIEARYGESPLATAILLFVQKTQRGIAHPRRHLPTAPPKMGAPDVGDNTEGPFYL